MNVGPTGLELDAADLRKIADSLDSLAGAGTMRVDDFVVHGYRVQLRRQESQTDGTWYVVTGIEREPRP